MIQSFREKLTGSLAIGLIILIAIPLAFIGVESIFLSGGRINVIAEVNGEEITEPELRRAIETRRSRFAQILGDNFSPDSIDEDSLRESAIKGLIEQKLYFSHAVDQDLGISDTGLSQQIRDIPQFQIGDEFSPVAFNNLLSQLGHTTTSFLEMYTEELVREQFRTTMANSGISSDLLLERVISVAREKRSYQYLNIPVQPLLASIEVSEDEILEYYETNLAEFQRPERVSLDYVEISVQDFIAQVEVDGDEVVQRFETMLQNQPDQLEVAHILIEPADDGSHLAKVEDIQNRLANGEDFEEVAKTTSEDPGSAANGGYIGTGPFPPEFDEQLQSLGLEEGAVSDPMTTSAGVHIVKLLSLKKSELKLDNEYAAIELEIKTEQATELYENAYDQLLDAAYQTDNLDQLVDEMAEIQELTLNSTELFERTTGIGIAANQQVRDTAFGSNVLVDKVNEIIPIGNDRAIVVHLREHIPSGVEELDVVQSRISETLKLNKGTTQLAVRAEALVGEMKGGGVAEDIARREGIAWQVVADAEARTGNEIGNQVFDASLDGGFPVIGSFANASGDYVVYSITSATAGDLKDFSAAQIRQTRSQYGFSLAASELEAYTKTLLSEADVDIDIETDLDI